MLYYYLYIFVHTEPVVFPFLLHGFRYCVFPSSIICLERVMSYKVLCFEWIFCHYCSKLCHLQELQVSSCSQQYVNMHVLVHICSLVILST